ncbi:MAG: outer membrane lipoprotein-sorting protein [Spirochaetales bacterium]|nr:outer membrane lipoprotein-sorting protein [Spirochaetales bacterium]
MKTRTILILILTAFSLVAATTSAVAQDASAIVADADRIFRLDGVYSRSTLHITRSGRDQAPQVIEGYELESRDGVSQTLSIFLSPPRVSGTAYLMVGDDMWVRFASTGRVRKLSSSARRNSAAGSDFSYADLGEGSRSFSDRYRAVHDGMERIDGVQSHRLILTPEEGDRDAYERLTVWITEADHRYLRIEYFEDGAAIKVMELDDFRTVADIEYPFRLTMRSVARDSVSVIVTESLEFDSARVEQRFFTTAYLDTIR